MKFMVKDKRKFNMLVLALLVVVVAIFTANILL